MTYKKQFGIYEVQSAYEGEKWFKDYDKAVALFNLMAKDLEDDEFVRLVNLKTGEVLMEKEAE